ncbi:MAG: ABC transporter permease, partial [Actinomycetota bacterium]|nr:ABC transporter permease [Actinomycetota bacterium]
MPVETTTEQHQLTVPQEPADEALARHSLLRRFLRDRLALVGLVLVSLFTIGALFAPVLAPHDPEAVDATRRLLASSWEHPLGTDELGRDTLSRILYGGRWSLGTAAVATLIVMVVGVAVGTLAGYYGGLLDAVLMRVVDVLLAFPEIVVYLAIVGTLGPGLRNVML